MATTLPVAWLTAVVPPCPRVTLSSPALTAVTCSNSPSTSTVSPTLNAPLRATGSCVAVADTPAVSAVPAPLSYSSNHQGVPSSVAPWSKVKAPLASSAVVRP